MDKTSLEMDLINRVFIDAQSEFSQDEFDKNEQRLRDLRCELRKKELKTKQLQEALEDAESAAKMVSCNYPELALVFQVYANRLRDKLKAQSPESFRHKIRELEKEQGLSKRIAKTLSKPLEKVHGTR